MKTDEIPLVIMYCLVAALAAVLIIFANVYMDHQRSVTHELVVLDPEQQLLDMLTVQEELIRAVIDNCK